MYNLIIPSDTKEQHCYHGCRIRRLKDMNCNLMVMGLPPVKFAVFLIAKSFGLNVGVSGIKREWYVCMY
jgi:hypothetical protein